VYEINCKLFFLTVILFFRGHLRLEKSCILVNTAVLLKNQKDTNNYGNRQTLRISPAGRWNSDI